MQLLVDKSKDRDVNCNICVFGLMGHGKSRLLNLILTAVSKEPSSMQASDLALSCANTAGPIFSNPACTGLGRRARHGTGARTPPDGPPDGPASIHGLPSAILSSSSCPGVSLPPSLSLCVPAGRDRRAPGLRARNRGVRRRRRRTSGGRWWRARRCRAATAARLAPTRGTPCRWRPERCVRAGVMWM